MILGTIPGVLFCSICYGIMLAWQTTMTVAISTYMIGPPYNFSAAAIGLMNIPPFIGVTLGAIVCGPISDWMALRLSKRNNGIYEPEMRFWVLLPFIPPAIAGAFWFGDALGHGKSWPQVAVSYGLNSFGSAPIQSICLTYMVDAYNGRPPLFLYHVLHATIKLAGCSRLTSIIDIIGDSVTALTFVRNMFSTIFVFAMPAFIASVGLANVFYAIGSIGLGVLSFAVVFIWQGKQFRVKTARIYKYYAGRQFEARPL